MSLFTKKAFWLTLGGFLVGFTLAGYLFTQSVGRPILSLKRCERGCLETKEVLGLLSSVGIQRFQGLVPGVVLETDKTIAIVHPNSSAPIHYLVIPKKDIRNAGEFSDETSEYLVDAFAVMDQLVRDKRLSKYRIVTNGPGYQQVTYLHFHLVGGTEDYQIDY